MRAKDLAEMAVHALGIGSSETYQRYISEDRFGPLIVYKDDGIRWVEFNPQWKKQVNEE